MFSMDIQPAGVSGNVELTYSTGLAVWETKTKKKPNGQSSFVPSGTPFPASALPTLYLEGVSGSTTFRDKELKATFVPCGASDTVKVTVFEVDLAGFFGFGAQHPPEENDKRFHLVNCSSDNCGRISWDDADADGNKVDTDPNCQYFRNCMECQGTIKPASVSNQVEFDIKRDKWVRAWQKFGSASDPWGNPVADETPWQSDDQSDDDEDLTPSTTNRIYSIDAPGSAHRSRSLCDYFAKIGNYREWVVVKIDGSWYQCSDYYKWHGKVYACPKGTTSPFLTRDDMSKQSLGSGWIEVPSNP
jgi:hypothetical protein